MIYRTSIGLDVHARSIASAAFVPETGEVIERGFAYDPATATEWARGLPQPARCVYESGPTGFGLKRKLGAAVVECVMGAVSKMLRPAGDRVRADRRDAVFLARMLAVGNIVEVSVPTEAMEAARDLARAREDCRYGLMRARHLLSKLLLRKGIVYPGKSPWTKAHREWLSGLAFEDAAEQLAFAEYLEGVRSLGLRRGRLDEATSERAEEGGPRHRRQGPQVHKRHLHRHGLLGGRRGRRLLALPDGPLVHVLCGARALGALQRRDRLPGAGSPGRATATPGRPSSRRSGTMRGPTGPSRRRRRPMRGARPPGLSGRPPGQAGASTRGACTPGDAESPPTS
nr:hypothetical protein [Olsenella sp. Marseille-P4559]